MKLLSHQYSYNYKLMYTPFIRNIRRYCSRKSYQILGIETSCDDTGCAIVNQNGQILGESLVSQIDIHSNFGGILPPLARDLHKDNIKIVVDSALKNAQLSINEVDAIAVTVKPGLPLSLLVGLNHAKQLCKESKKPIIPIHHMKAHALTIRMIGKVDFPFLVLLASGGHCILSVAKDVDDFIILGQTLDDAPGEALDKIFRRMKLGNLEEMKGLSGGQGIEKAAAQGNPDRFSIAEPLLQSRDCNFSFAGIKNSVRKAIMKEELDHDIEGDGIIPHVNDMCASVQLAVTKHLCRRVQRAIAYIKMENLVPTSNPCLVVSGGVASNQFIKNALSNLCFNVGFTLHVPPPKLCTDNGVMIAWNGVEKYLMNDGIFSHQQLDLIDIQPKSPLGKDLSEEVKAANMKVTWISNKKLFTQHVSEEISSFS